TAPCPLQTTNICLKLTFHSLTSQLTLQAPLTCSLPGARQTTIAKPRALYIIPVTVKKNTDRHDQADPSPLGNTCLHQALPGRKRLPADACGDRSGAGFQIAQRRRGTSESAEQERRYRNDARRIARDTYPRLRTCSR